MTNNKQSTIFLICGTICSGKSTFSKKLEIETGAIRFNIDEWIHDLFKEDLTRNKIDKIWINVEGLILKVAEKCIQRKMSVIFDYGFWNMKHRKQYKNFSENLGTNCILYYLNTGVNVLKKRVLERNKNMKNQNMIIGDEMFSNYLNQFEKPRANEGIEIRENK